MTNYAAANPYELWETHELLGVFRDERPETWMFDQFFTNQMRSPDEWIDFEKLPIRSRKLAPFVKPLGRGHGVFTDKAKGYRFKPANIVVEDAVDPLRPLTFQPGIDRSMLHPGELSPMERLDLIKTEMVNEFILSIERRWEWMRARAIIDGAVTVTYKDGSSVVVDFQRDSGQTETLTSGNKWGDSGVSIMSHVQRIIDTMTAAQFGGMPLMIQMGGNVAPVVRADAEIKSHMDLTVSGGAARVDRGLVAGGQGGLEKVYKFGELMVGGASGAVIELVVNNETFTADDGTETKYLGANDIVVTGSPSAINGYECFGRIVDRDAEYQALPIFPKNFLTGDRVKVENISAESAPLFVPINPNATYKATVL